jgi:RNA polymerase sigma factor (sigma-70 family)
MGIGEIHGMDYCYERARDGDRIATETVVESLRPRLARMAAYYARCSGEDADDLLQEAWVGLLEALPVLDMGIGSPDQYLIQRARWRLLDAIKRARVRRCAFLEEEAVERADPSMAEAEEAACVCDFAGHLKGRQRQILDCLLAGFTWREAGHVLGCTSANIAYHVRQIRRQYEDWCGVEVQAA